MSMLQQVLLWKSYSSWCYQCMARLNYGRAYLHGCTIVQQNISNWWRPEHAQTCPKNDLYVYQLVISSQSRVLFSLQQQKTKVSGKQVFTVKPWPNTSFSNGIRGMKVRNTIVSTDTDILYGFFSMPYKVYLCQEISDFDRVRWMKNVPQSSRKDRPRAPLGDDVTTFNQTN